VNAGLAGVEAAAAGQTAVHRLDPRAKIVGLIGLVLVAVATPPGAWGAFAVYLAVAATMAAAARVPPRYVARRLVIEVPFLVTAALLLWVRGPVEGLTLAARVTTGVLAMVVLSSTTPLPDLLRGFEHLGAPRVLLVIVAFGWRYLHVIGDEVRRMRIAREARGYRPSSLWQARTAVGATIGTLFVRSYERGERVYLAMLSRGYRGGMPATVVAPLAMAPADVAFVAGLTAVVGSARILLA
jgi:cobalt/nickel transport system permease protein